MVHVDDGTQTEVVLEQLEKGRAKDREDTVMKDGSNNSDSYRELYEDLSRYSHDSSAGNPKLLRARGTALCTCHISQ